MPRNRRKWGRKATSPCQQTASLSVPTAGFPDISATSMYTGNTDLPGDLATASNGTDLKGRTSSPLVEVPSGKIRSLSPEEIRPAIRSAKRPADCRSSRSTNSVSPNFARKPIRGHRAISLFETNATGRTLLKTKMSAYPRWFETASHFPDSGGSPITSTRIPRTAQSARDQVCRIIVRYPPLLWRGTAHTVAYRIPPADTETRSTATIRKARRIALPEEPPAKSAHDFANLRDNKEIRRPKLAIIRGRTAHFGAHPEISSKEGRK
jgi:hypothetical protein